eukprot:gene31028-38350_t
MRWLYAVLAGVVQDADKDSNSGTSPKFVKRLTVELFLVLFNNLAATFIASALFNHSCFYYVLVASESPVPIPCSQYEFSVGSCFTYELEDQAAK